MRPRRRAVAIAFLSVESSCSSLNSLSAAKLAASATDHSTRRGSAERTKEAMRGRLNASMQ